MVEPLAVAHRDHVRSPVDVMRLIVGAVVIVLGVGLANVADSAFLGLSQDGRTLMESLPAWSRDVASTTLAALTIAASTTAVVWALLTTRFRRLSMLVGAFVLGSLLSILLGEVLLHVVDSDVRSAFDIDELLFRYVRNGRVHPGDPLLAGAVAMLGVSASYLRNHTVTRVSVGLMLYGLVSAWTTSRRSDCCPTSASGSPSRRPSCCSPAGTISRPIAPNSLLGSNRSGSNW